MARSDADPAPRRILVTGPPGSGKSTVARELGRRLALPVTHLDRLYWNPGWVASGPEVMRARVADVVARPAWVIDGNYGGTYDLRMARAELVVVLDLPRRVTMPSILRRRWQHRGTSRPDLPTGCPEKIDREFVLFCWRWPRHGRPTLVAALADTDVRRVQLRSRREVRRWLATVPDAAA